MAFPQAQTTTEKAIKMVAETGAVWGGEEAQKTQQNDVSGLACSASSGAGRKQEMVRDEYLRTVPGLVPMEAVLAVAIHQEKGLAR